MTTETEALEATTRLKHDLILIKQMPEKMAGDELGYEAWVSRKGIDQLLSDIETIRASLQFDPEAVIKEIEGLKIKHTAKNRTIEEADRFLHVNQTADQAISIIRKHMNQEKENQNGY